MKKIAEVFQSVSRRYIIQRFGSNGRGRSDLNLEDAVELGLLMVAMGMEHKSDIV